MGVNSLNSFFLGAKFLFPVNLFEINQLKFKIYIDLYI